MLERDVKNITAYCGQYAPELLTTEYDFEMWKLYQSSELRPDSVLTGRFDHDQTVADVGSVLHQIDEARYEAEARQRGRDEAEAGG
jgi:RIO kinase 1